MLKEFLKIETIFKVSKMKTQREEGMEPRNVFENIWLGLHEIS